MVDLFLSLGVLLFVLTTTAPATTMMVRLFFLLIIVLVVTLLVGLTLALVLPLSVLVDLHDHWQKNGVALGLVKEEAIQFLTNILLQVAPVKFLLVKVFLDDLFNQVSTLLHQLPVSLNKDKTA